MTIHRAYLSLALLGHVIHNGSRSDSLSGARRALNQTYRLLKYALNSKNLTNGKEEQTQ